MANYWVVGGEYTDTSFKKVISGAEEEKLGPFQSYEQAHQVWTERAWATVDNCHSRFCIIKHTEDDYAPCATD